MSRVWYTSDLHLQHRVVAAHRGFLVPVSDTFKDSVARLHPGVLADLADPEAHDAWLQDLWDSTVSHGDTVYILGDLSVKSARTVSPNGPGISPLEWIAQRPGKKRLIAGNHDEIHPMHSVALRRLKEWHSTFESVSSTARLKLVGHDVLLSHFPYWPHDRHEPRYEQWRTPDLGTPLLHGHTHGPETHTRSAAGSPMFHVGIDAHRALVSQEEVITWLTSLQQ